MSQRKVIPKQSLTFYAIMSSSCLFARKTPTHPSGLSSNTTTSLETFDSPKQVPLFLSSWVLLHYSSYMLLQLSLNLEVAQQLPACFLRAQLVFPSLHFLEQDTDLTCNHRGKELPMSQHEGPTLTHPSLSFPIPPGFFLSFFFNINLFILTRFRISLSILLEKETATHSSILAWKMPWTEEPSGWATICGVINESDTTEHECNLLDYLNQPLPRSFHFQSIFPWIRPIYTTVSIILLKENFN